MFTIGQRVKVHHPVHCKTFIGHVYRVENDETVVVRYDRDSVPFRQIVTPPEWFPGQTPRPLPESWNYTHEIIHVSHLEAA